MSAANLKSQVAVSMLRKTLDLQETNAQQMLQALPAPAPAPASSGSVGTRINTFA